MVVPFFLYHQSTGDMSSASYAAAQTAFKQKWGGTRPSLLTTLLPDPARPSEVRRTSADFDSAVRRGLDQAQRSTGASLQRARYNVSRRIDAAKPGGIYGGNGPKEAEVVYEPQSPSLKACLLCGQPMKTISGGLPLVSCQLCQIFGTWPPPRTDDSGSEIFDLSYSGERSRRRKQWIYEAKQRLAWIETWVPDGILLEIGSATGELIQEATVLAYEAIGIEPSKWAADIAQRSGAEAIWLTGLSRTAASLWTRSRCFMFWSILKIRLNCFDSLGRCWQMMAGCLSKRRTLPVGRRSRSTHHGLAGSSGSISGISPRCRCGAS